MLNPGLRRSTCCRGSCRLHHRFDGLIFSIRPYCVKHWQGHHTGANVGSGYLNDWQHAKEIISGAMAA